MSRLFVDNTMGRSMRSIGKKVLGRSGVEFVRRWCLNRTVPDLSAYRSRLGGKKALEIGGPSDIFSAHGALPIYAALASADNCQYSTRTIWTGDIQSGSSFQYHPKRSHGIQLFCEATNLKQVPDSSYEVVLASHCLEHIANPIRALTEWKRVLTNRGFLLAILPHKDGTFDWRRPVTPLEHMIRDYETNIGEDDLTHLPEILALHDLERDPAAGSPAQFEQRCADNKLTRAMHHHVFDSRTAAMLVAHCGFQVIRVAAVKPFHIIILAARSEDTAGASQPLWSESEFHLESPFPSDQPWSQRRS